MLYRAVQAAWRTFVGTVAGKLPPRHAPLCVFLMTGVRLAERLIEVTDWGNLRSIAGDGTGVRRALEQLLGADRPEAAEAAYWGFENVAVVQGELFEVAEACAAVLIAALAEPRPRWVRISAVELLFQIACGHASTAANTPRDLAERCRKVIHQGLWLLHREALTESGMGAFELLEQLGEAELAARLKAI